jgi:hypothetical protein
MSEANLYKQLKNNWNHYLKRMEPGIIGQGFPDCHMVNPNKRDLFVELKFLPKAFKNKKMPIKNSQIIWFLEYKGENAYFLFKIDKTFYVFHKSKAILLKDNISLDTFEINALLVSKDIKKIIDLFEKVY